MLIGKGLKQLVFGDEATRQSDLAGLLGRGLGFFEDVPQLIFIEEAKVNEHLAEATAAAVRCLFGANGSRLERRLLGGGLLGLAGLGLSGLLGSGLACGGRLLG